MKRRILALWAWLTGWFRAPYIDPAGYDFDLGPESSSDSRDFGDIVLGPSGAVVDHDAEVMATYPPARVAVYPTLPPGFGVAAASFKPSDDEVEATRRMNERSANMHKQPCQVVIDAKVADLERQLRDARLSRGDVQHRLDIAQDRVEALCVGERYALAALNRAFPKHQADRIENLTERAVAELLKLRETRLRRSRAKAARTKVRTR